MLVVYADTAEEFKEEALVYLRALEKRERTNITSHKTQRDQQAQRARANCVQNILLDFENLVVAPKKEERHGSKA